jgi:predicted permease
MEEKAVKTLAVVAVLAIAAYALYKLFENTQLAAIGATPGTTTANLASVPGVSVFQIFAPTSATPQAIASAAAQNLAEYTPAFGESNSPTSETLGSTDYNDLDMSSGDDYGD